MTSLPQPKKKRFYKRWWFWLLVILALVITGGVIGGGSVYQTAQRAKLGNLEEVVKVEKHVLQKTISTNGTITPDATTQLFVSRPGKVKEVNVKVGDEVNKDDVLIKTDGGSLPDEEIKAPFDGRILSIRTFVDDNASVTGPVIEIGFRSNHVEFIASEAEVIDLRINQHASITVPSYENGKTEYDGIVTFVDVQKQIVTSAAAAGTVAESGYVIKVSADDLPSDIKKIVGLSVDLVVDIYETEPVLALEPSAIQYDDNDEPFVFLPPELTEEFINTALQAETVTDVLETKDVETGFQGDQYIEIKDGLKEGEEVLLYIPATGAAGLF